MEPVAYRSVVRQVVRNRYRPLPLPLTTKPTLPVLPTEAHYATATPEQQGGRA